MADYIRASFASKGDKEAIPFYPDGKTPLDFERGYPATFELDPDAGGEWIQRKHFNYIMFQLSQAIQELQRNGTRDYDKVITQEGGYNCGESCLINYNPYTRELVETLPTDFLSESNYIQKLKIVSLIDNNKVNPYDTNALFDTWMVDNGSDLGSIQIDSINHKNAPAGYLKVNTNAPDTTYSFNTYKRVRELLKDVSVGSQYGVFIKYSLDAFKFVDIRGHFMRTFSNGSSIDSARNFNALQLPALPNIKGILGLIGSGYGYNTYTGAFLGVNINDVVGDDEFTHGKLPGTLDSYKSGMSTDPDIFRSTTFYRTSDTRGYPYCNIFNARKFNRIYTNNHNDVTPHNYNVNVLVKV